MIPIGTFSGPDAPGSRSGKGKAKKESEDQDEQNPRSVSPSPTPTPSRRERIKASRNNKAAQAQPPSPSDGLFRKTGRLFGVSSSSSVPRDSDAATARTSDSSADRSVQSVNADTDHSDDSPKPRPGAPGQPRNSSASSLDHLSASRVRPSTSSQGQASGSPEAKLAPPLPTSAPRDTRYEQAIDLSDLPDPSDLPLLPLETEEEWLTLTESSSSRPSTATGDYKTHTLPQGNPPQRVRELAMKRIGTLDYFKKVLEGRTYWFNTIYYSRADLAKIPYFDPQKLTIRALNFFYLGNSIPAALDPIADNLLEWLKTFNDLLSEFEHYQTLHHPDGTTPSTMSRVRMPTMFKRVTSGPAAGKARRTSEFGSVMSASQSSESFASAGPGGPGASGSTGAGQEYVYLLLPHVPFDLDFFEVFTTLCDVLIDCYTTIMGLIAGSDAPIPPAVHEQFLKCDNKIRKIVISEIVRDFDKHSRESLKYEINNLTRLVLGGLV